MSFLYSVWMVCLLPLPSILVAGIIASVGFAIGKSWDVIPAAVAFGIPLPLCASYILLFVPMGGIPWSLGMFLSALTLFAPQAYLLLLVGVWLLVAAVRGREFTFISSLTIFLISFVGHLWTLMLVLGFRDS